LYLFHSYVIGVSLFLSAIAIIQLQMRRESRPSGQSHSTRLVLHSSAQLLHRLSIQFSVLAVLLLICFVFRAGYERVFTNYFTTAFLF
jgi:hypothetical protein